MIVRLRSDFSSATGPQHHGQRAPIMQSTRDSWERGREQPCVFSIGGHSPSIAFTTGDAVATFQGSFLSYLLILFVSFSGYN